MNMNYKELSLLLDYKLKQPQNLGHNSDKSKSRSPEALTFEGDERFKREVEFELEGGGNGGHARPSTPSRHMLEKRPGGYFP